MRAPTALTLLLLTACGNGLGNGLQIRGKLGAEFGDLTAARSADAGTVDTLVAVPHIGGVPHLPGVVTADADADARFEITVDEFSDHVLMFVDASTQPDPTVLGFLAMPANSGSVVNLTTSDATQDVDAGDVSNEGGEAVGSEDVSDVLGLSEEQFALLARGDDAFKNIANAWLNTDGDTYARADVNYWFEGSFDSADAPGAAAFRPAGLVFNTNRADVISRLPEICSGAIEVELVPPAEITLDGITYGPDNPLTNAGLDEFCSGALSFGEYPGELYMGIPTSETAWPSGWWLWNVDGEEIGFFELDHTLPVDGSGNPTVPVPTLDLTETGGRVEARITWWVQDGGDYVEFTDLALLRRLFASVGIHVSTDGSEGEWQGGWDANMALDEVAFDGWTLDGSGDTEGEIVGEISLGYVLAGTQYMFSWRGNPVCGNGWAEGDEACDGDDIGITCGELGLFDEGFVSCDNECAYDTSTCAQGLTATRVCSDQLAFSMGGPIETNTIAFAVATDTYAFEGEDLWATLSGDTTLTGRLPLAPGEDGVRHLGTGWIPGDSALVAFQVSSPGVSTGSEKLVLWDGPPDTLNPPTQLWEGPVETWTVRTAQETTNSTITTIDTPDDGAPLGAMQRVLVSGTTDAIGGTGRIDLHAATDIDWRADHIELEAVDIEAWQAGTSTAVRLCADAACTTESNPLQDALVAYVPDDAAVDWQATLTFRMSATLPTPVTSAALIHDSATGLQGPLGVPGVGLFPAANGLELTLDDTSLPPSQADPTTWVGMAVVNPTGHDIVADGVGFDVPEHVTVIDLVGWHDQGGLGFDRPPNLLTTADGTRMLVYDRLVIPANSAVDFQAKLQFDGTLGVYPIAPFVLIGNTEVSVETPQLIAFDGSASSCAAGAYHDGTECVACPNGTTSVAGSGSVGDCFPCPADTYLNLTECVACPEGTGSTEGSVNPGDCVAGATPPVITAVDFSPRNDSGIDAVALDAVTFTTTATASVDHPVTEVIFTIEGPDGFLTSVSGALTGASWDVQPADPLGAYTVTAIAFNDLGGSDPFTLSEPVDIGYTEVCGNLSVDPDEDCDGEASVTSTCTDLGFFEPGTVTCTSQCAHDTSSCAQGAVIEDVSGVGLVVDPSDWVTKPWVALDITRDADDAILDQLTVELVPEGVGFTQLAAGESGVRALPPLQRGETSSAWFQLDYCRDVPALDCPNPDLGDALLATVSVRGSDASVVRELALSIPLLDSGATNAEKLSSLEWGYSGNAIGDCVDADTGASFGTTCIDDADCVYSNLICDHDWHTYLGGVVPMTAYGQTYTGGPLDPMPFTWYPNVADTDDSRWPAEFDDGSGTLELVGSSIDLWDEETHQTPVARCTDATCTSSTTDPTVDDQVVWIPATNSPVFYRATAEWRVIDQPTADLWVAPTGLAVHSSGAFRHPSISDFAGAASAAPFLADVRNATILPELTIDGGTSVQAAVPYDTTVTLTFVNNAPVDVHLDEVALALPLQIDVRQAQWGSRALPAPVGVGWVGDFVVPASGSQTLTVDVRVTAHGSTTLDGWGSVGLYTIDQTTDVQDFSPASVWLTVSAP